MEFFENMDGKKWALVIGGGIVALIVLNVILGLLGLNVFFLPLLLGASFLFPQVRDKARELKDEYFSKSDDGNDRKF